MPAPYTGSITLSFSAVQNKYKQVFMCTVKQNEFNSTYNASYVDASGSIYSPDLRPYVTTIGLYDDDHNLLMVAKLTQPVMISPNVETNFQINVGW